MLFLDVLFSETSVLFLEMLPSGSHSSGEEGYLPLLGGSAAFSKLFLGSFWLFVESLKPVLGSLKLFWESFSDVLVPISTVVPTV